MDERVGHQKSGPALSAPAERPRSSIANLKIIDRLVIDDVDRVGPLPFLMRALVAAAVNPNSAAPVCIVLPDVDGVAEIIAAIASLIMLRNDWSQLKERFLQEELPREKRPHHLRDTMLCVP